MQIPLFPPGRGGLFPGPRILHHHGEAVGQTGQHAALDVGRRHHPALAGTGERPRGIRRAGDDGERPEAMALEMGEKPRAQRRLAAEAEEEDDRDDDYDGRD